MNENYPQRRRSSYDEELRQKYLIQKRKRMAHVRRLRILFCCLAVVIIAVIIFAVTVALRSGSKADKPDTSSRPGSASSDNSSSDPQKETMPPVQNTTETSAPSDQSADLVAQADRLAASYDYDAAMDLLKGLSLIHI